MDARPMANAPKDGERYFNACSGRGTIGWGRDIFPTGSSCMGCSIKPLRREGFDARPYSNAYWIREAVMADQTHRGGSTHRELDITAKKSKAKTNTSPEKSTTAR